MEMDHIALAGSTLDEATRASEMALGVPLQQGGAHAVFHTHNTLLGLEDGLYLEAIAINPDAPTPDRARWFDLGRFEGPARLTNWICRCSNLDATLGAIAIRVWGARVFATRGFALAHGSSSGWRSAL